MKRLVFLTALMIMLTVFASALAEPYTLHAGVQFGMTADEVIEKEKDRGNTFEMTDGRLTNTNQVSIVDMNATIYFDFDSEGNLIRQQYRFRDQVFDSVRNKFEKVYGLPNCSSAADTKLSLPSYFKSFSGPMPSADELGKTIINNSMVSYSYSGLTYCQWMVEVEEGFVVIEQYGRSLNAKVGSKSSGAVANLIYVDYNLFTKEEIMGAIDETAAKYDDL